MILCDVATSMLVLLTRHHWIELGHWIPSLLQILLDIAFLIWPNELSFDHPFVPTRISWLSFLSPYINPLGAWSSSLCMLGLLWITILIKISLPAWDNNFSFHLWIFFPNPLLNVVETCLFIFPTNDGNPKFFSYCLISRTPYQNVRNKSKQDQASLTKEAESYKGICRTSVKLYWNCIFTLIRKRVQQRTSKPTCSLY